MSLRESPIRAQHRRTRPVWLIVVLIVVGILVVAGLGYGLMSLLRGDDGAAASDPASASPSPCPTELVPVGDLLPAPRKVTVNVYNATTTSGLASKTATALEEQGFRVGKVANDPAGRDVVGVAEIRYGPNAEDAARLVLAYVPGAELVALERKGPRVDLAVGAAFTDLADEAAVTATLASPTPAPAACASSPAP